MTSGSVPTSEHPLLRRLRAGDFYWEKNCHSQFNRITDTLATSITFGSVTGSTQINSGNSSKSPSNGSTGTIRWDGQPQQYYAVPANSSVTLVYTANVPGTIGTYPNTAKANSGNTEFGNVTTTVRILGPTAVTLSNLSVKSDPGTGMVLWSGVLIGIALAGIGLALRARRHERPATPR